MGSALSLERKPIAGAPWLWEDRSVVSLNDGWALRDGEHVIERIGNVENVLCEQERMGLVTVTNLRIVWEVCRCELETGSDRRSESKGSWGLSKWRSTENVRARRFSLRGGAAASPERGRRHSTGFAHAESHTHGVSVGLECVQFFSTKKCYSTVYGSELPMLHVYARAGGRAVGLDAYRCESEFNGELLNFLFCLRLDRYFDFLCKIEAALHTYRQSHLLLFVVIRSAQLWGDYGLSLADHAVTHRVDDVPRGGAVSTVSTRAGGTAAHTPELSVAGTSHTLSLTQVAVKDASPVLRSNGSLDVPASGRVAPSNSGVGMTPGAEIGKTEIPSQSGLDGRTLASNSTFEVAVLRSNGSLDVPDTEAPRPGATRVLVRPETPRGHSVPVRKTAAAAGDCSPASAMDAEYASSPVGVAAGTPGVIYASSPVGSPHLPVSNGAALDGAGAVFGGGVAPQGAASLGSAGYGSPGVAPPGAPSLRSAAFGSASVAPAGAPSLGSAAFGSAGMAPPGSAGFGSPALAPSAGTPSMDAPLNSESSEEGATGAPARLKVLASETLLFVWRDCANLARSCSYRGVMVLTSARLIWSHLDRKVNLDMNISIPLIHVLNLYTGAHPVHGHSLIVKINNADKVLKVGFTFGDARPPSRGPEAGKQRYLQSQQALAQIRRAMGAPPALTLAPARAPRDAAFDQRMRAFYQSRLPRGPEPDALAALHGKSAQPPGAEAPGRAPTGKCLICLTSGCELALDPCGHVCICDTCAPHVSSCPVCRCPILKVLRLYIAA